MSQRVVIKNKNMSSKNDDITAPKSPSEDLGIELRSEEFQEILGSVPPWILRWGITVLAIVVVILLIGSAIIKYPDIVPTKITLTGSVPPAAIAARASGKLKELYVNDNQSVKAGDYLAVIDNSTQTEDLQKLKVYLENQDFGKDLQLPEKELRLGNLQSLYSTFYTTLSDYQKYRRIHYYPQKIEMIEERIKQTEEQYEILLRQQKIANEQFALTQKQYQKDSLMLIKGGISGKELDASKSAYLQGLSSQESMTASLKNMEMQIATLKESLFDMSYQDNEKLTEFQSQLRSQISQLKTEIQSWEMNYVLVAPIDGKITFTNYWIINQNVNGGAEIFTIVPTEEHKIIGKATLPTARSGKVKAGQKVNIRVENFPENEYGILRGTILNISLVPTQSGEVAYYSVEVALPDKLITTYQKELPYLPNMQGQADIITDDISLMERFFLPLKKILTQ
ncbi:hemolysin [Bacteroidia bacterium]|nr:hemolysin [Bacteroidia bacterium]